MTSEPSSPYDHELPAGQEPEVPHRSSDQRLRFSPAKTIAAFIVALACLVTAGAAVTMAVHSDRQAQRSDERVAELVDAIEYGGDSSVDPSTSNAARSSSKKTDKKKTSATPKGGDKAKAADTVRGVTRPKRLIVPRANIKPRTLRLQRALLTEVAPTTTEITTTTTGKSLIITTTKRLQLRTRVFLNPQRTSYCTVF